MKIGILAQLLEKKDLMVYIQERLTILEYERKKIVKDLPPKKRELAHRLIIGRIKELKHLRHVMTNGLLKDQGKKMWRLNRQRGEEE